MRNIWTIAKREYRLYFSSPMAYVVALVVVLWIGIYFGIATYIGMTLTAASITGNLPMIFIFSVPALTMRLVADEHRMGTLELMLTAPVRDAELIVGKWLGVFLFMLTLLAFTLIYPFILSLIITPGIDNGLLLAAYLGTTLLAAAFLAIGVGCSALFNNPLVAFIVTLITIVVMYVFIGWPAYLPIKGTEVFTYLSLVSHFDAIANAGKFALSDIVYFLSVTAFGLFVGSAAVEMRRWR